MTEPEPTGPPPCTTRCHRMTADGLCPWCADRLRRELWQLRDLHAAVTADLARGSTPGERITGTREAPVPVRVDALSWVGPHAPGAVCDPHGDQSGAIPLAATLTEWCRLVCQEHPAVPPRQTVSSMVCMLVAYLPWAARQPWADDYAAEIHQQARIGRGLAGIRPDVERVTQPCPRCDIRRVVRDHTTGRYECQESEGGCGTIWTWAEWQDRMHGAGQVGAA